ncbi:hypothetical protein K503DRAFT_101647 [Rhizopogon vinicolor AM-OR11-026]|uniref:Uncharacterized protein n=1 Tax=Rhizopogon vinicolor AM-OR11-026 TaxID=1314800 RepID=A0A1B7MFA5_9AGAM|nr:hypothetical protein K503DRAFT_101647 [Rhizopogon vinicolor AM-OR11-026]
MLSGAVAELFDTLCLYGTPAFDSAPTVTYDAWPAATHNVLVLPVPTRAKYDSESHCLNEDVTRRGSKSLLHLRAVLTSNVVTDMYRCTL